MKTAQATLKGIHFSESELASVKEIEPNLVFVFGGVSFFKSQETIEKIKKNLPNAILVGCSTAGEISNKGVSDNSLVVTGLATRKGNLKSTVASITNGQIPLKLGRK
jgi:hypothetical protein